MIRWLHKTLRNNRGVAAIEFALVLPLLILLFLGVVEVGRYLLVNQKLDRATNAMADLATRPSSVSDNDLQTFALGMGEYLRPYPVNFGTASDCVVFSLIEVGNATGNEPKLGKVTRQFTFPQGATCPSAAGGLNTQYNGMYDNISLQPADKIWVVDSRYDYRPLIQQRLFTFLPLQVTMKKGATIRTRLTQTGACTITCVEAGETPPPECPQNLPICNDGPPTPCPPCPTIPPGVCCDINDIACVALYSGGGVSGDPNCTCPVPICDDSDDGTTPPPSCPSDCQPAYCQRYTGTDGVTQCGGGGPCCSPTITPGGTIELNRAEPPASERAFSLLDLLISPAEARQTVFDVQDGGTITLGLPYCSVNCPSCNCPNNPCIHPDCRANPTCGCTIPALPSCKSSCAVLVKPCGCTSATDNQNWSNYVAQYNALPVCPDDPCGSNPPPPPGDSNSY